MEGEKPLNAELRDRCAMALYVQMFAEWMQRNGDRAFPPIEDLRVLADEAWAAGTVFAEAQAGVL